MTNNLIFLSDVHLGAPLLENDRDREKQLIDCLEFHASENAAIYIVGDLFEFWFEYREVVPRKNFRILSCLHQLSLAQTEIHYLMGNHDLWINSFFSEEIGINVHKTGISVAAGEKKIFVTHGDGTAAQDSGYRFIRRIFTNPFNIRLFRLFHPDFGIPFAKRMSQVSRDKGEAENAWEEQYREHAVSYLKNGYYGYIMGHTHWPLHEKINNSHYINLGDWIHHFSYCEYRDGQFALKTWPSKQIIREPVTNNAFDHLF